MRLSAAKVAALAAALFFTGTASASPPPQAGQETEITRRYSTESKSSGGSSGSSSGRTTIVERVLAVGNEGVVLEYDLPRSTSLQDRDRQWEFPARVLKPAAGPAKLLNRRDLEARRDIWLKAAGLSHDQCGVLIFTWTAFRIECDPDSALKIIEGYDIAVPEIHDAATYNAPEAQDPGRLTRTAETTTGGTYDVAMKINPAFVHRLRAESDVAVGELMREPVTLDEALRQRTREQVSGTLSVKLETDLAGNIGRRTKVTKIETIRLDGEVESETATEVIERIPRSEAVKR